MSQHLLDQLHLLDPADEVEASRFWDSQEAFAAVAVRAREPEPGQRAVSPWQRGIAVAAATLAVILLAVGGIMLLLTPNPLEPSDSAPPSTTLPATTTVAPAVPSGNDVEPPLRVELDAALTPLDVSASPQGGIVLEWTPTDPPPGRSRPIYWPEAGASRTGPFTIIPDPLVDDSPGFSTSSGGATWIPIIEPPIQNVWSQRRLSNGSWVVEGQEGGAFVSTDGATWRDLELSGQSGWPTGLAYSHGLVVGLAEVRTPEDAAVPFVETAFDPDTLSRSGPDLPGLPFDLDVIAGRFFALTGGQELRVYSSDDGLAWTQVALPEGAIQVEFDEGQIVVAADRPDGSAVSLWSSIGDGNWVEIVAITGATTIYDLDVGPSGFGLVIRPNVPGGPGDAVLVVVPEGSKPIWVSEESVFETGSAPRLFGIGIGDGFVMAWEVDGDRWATADLP